MSINVGGINLVEAIINIDYELNRTQRILDWVINNNQLRFPDADAIKLIEAQALETLKTKYPEAGIKAK